MLSQFVVEKGSTIYLTSNLLRSKHEAGSITLVRLLKEVTLNKSFKNITFSCMIKTFILVLNIQNFNCNCWLYEAYFKTRIGNQNKFSVNRLGCLMF